MFIYISLVVAVIYKYRYIASVCSKIFHWWGFWSKKLCRSTGLKQAELHVLFRTEDVSNLHCLTQPKRTVPTYFLKFLLNPQHFRSWYQKKNSSPEVNSSANSPLQDILHGFCYTSLVLSYQGGLEDNLWSSDPFSAKEKLVVLCQVKHGL